MTVEPDQVVVTYEGRTPPIDDGDAAELLEHVREYEPPADYAEASSNATDLDPAGVADARVAWGDPLPADGDSEVDPHGFVADHEDGRVRVRFGTTLDALETFDDALAHVFEATPLETDTLVAEVGVDASLGLEDLSLDLSTEGIGLAVFSRSDRSLFRVSARGADGVRLEWNDDMDEYLEGARTSNWVAQPGDAANDHTGEFSVREMFESVVDAVADRMAAIGDADVDVGSAVLKGGAQTEPVDPDGAVELLEHLEDYDPTGSPLDRIATGGDPGPETVTEAGVAWADHEPDREMSESYVRFGGDPNLAYAGYDEDDRAVSVTVLSTWDAVGAVDDLLEHVYEETGLVPGEFELDVQAATDHAFEGDDFDVPEGFELLTGEGEVTVVATERAVVEDTATTFSLSETFEPPVWDVVDAIDRALGGDRAWDRIADLRADLEPAADDPEAAVEEYMAGATETDPDLALARVTAVAHSEGIWNEDTLREYDTLEVGGEDASVTVEATVVERDVGGGEFEAVLSDHEGLEGKLEALLAMPGLGGDLGPDDLAALASRERVAIVDVTAEVAGHGTEEDTMLVATEDGDWKVVL